AQVIKVPMLFAKKSQTKNLSNSVYSAKVMSYTHGKVYDIFVSKEYLKPTDNVLIIDDFLANGEALRGLISLIEQAGAHLVGCGIAIEKGFQGGGDTLRQQGIKVESLAIIDSMTDDSLAFRP
ncbi:MAG TPA: phosphoribosyltransferase family protein, partial [Clostridia bacterium]|nr:phosphoribosyltransferase family protein [Clostridia bacterium]